MNTSWDPDDFPAEAYLQFGREVLAAQPFSRLMRAELSAYERGSAEIAVPVLPEFEQHQGRLHGGVLSYAADTAMAFAAGSVLGPAIVTAEYKINFLKTAGGEHLVARAEVVSAGTRQTVCLCKVWSPPDEDGTLCAVAQGTFVSVQSP